MKRIALLALSGLAAATAPAAAEEIWVEAPIQAVTVYPLGATIIRESPITLPQGTSVVVVDHIPLGIDANSIRVDGMAGASAQIQGVSVRRAEEDADGDPARQELVTQIEDLRDDLQALEDERAGLEAQRQFINNLIETGPAGFADLLGAQGGGIDQWQAAWDLVGEGVFRVERSLRDVDLLARDIDEEIRELLDELANLPTEPPHLEILIETAAVAATELVLEVSYRVSNAGWRPAYDAFLTTEAGDDEPSISLVRRAEIYQTTGEDWSDVAVTLSTTRPSGGTQAPTVGEQVIGVYEVNDRVAAAPAPGLAMEAAEAMALGGDANQPVGQLQAVADFGDFRADFVIPVPVSIASGAGARSVQLATDDAQARLFVEVAPRLAEVAYLTASFTVASEAPVLAGEVTLFRDDAYVGTGQIAFANPGEEISLGFGVDDQVRVTWTLASRDSGERGLLNRVAFVELEYRAIIDNNHSRDIEIMVVDRIPVSEHERVVVTRLEQTTEPTEEGVDGRRGVLAWTYGYAAGESREITIAYSISWPVDLSIYGAN
jgi:uncharacterized protein (TIGR02231 family)